MASKYSIEAVFKAIDQFTAPIRNMQKSSNKLSASIQTDFAKAQREALKFKDNFSKNVSKAVSSIGKITAKIGIASSVAAGVAGAAFIKISKDAIDLASDLTEVQNVVDVTFGKNADKINKWSKTALQSFGLSELQAKKFTSTLGAMMKSSGLAGDKLVIMSQNMSALAGDMASFYNLDIEDAFEKIKSGISGETEPLKALGIDMSVGNLEEAFDIDWKSLTSAEKTMYRYKYLMKASKDAQGDFLRTMDNSLANQRRVIGTTISQILARLGSVFLPGLIKISSSILKAIQSIDVEDIASKLETFVSSIDFDYIINNIQNTISNIISFIKQIDFNSIFNKVKDIVSRIFYFVKQIDFKTILNFMFNLIKTSITIISVLKPFIPIILGIVAAFKAYQTIMLAAAVAQMAFNIIMAANPISIIIIAIGILIGLIYILIKNWDIVKNAVINFVNTAFNFLDNLFNKIYEFIDSAPWFLQAFIMPFKIGIDLVRTLLAIWKNVVNAFKENGIKSALIEIGKGIIALLITPLQNVLGLISKIPLVGNITSGLSEKMNDIKSSLVAPTTKEERANVTKTIENTTKGIVEIRDTTGKAKMTRPINTKNPNITFKPSGAF